MFTSCTGASVYGRKGAFRFVKISHRYSRFPSQGLEADNHGFATSDFFEATANPTPLIEVLLCIVMVKQM